MTDIPSYDPQDPESRQEIPARFIAEGFLQLDKDGNWLIQNEPITHPKLTAFLTKQLRRTAEGEYWVVNGPQRVLVELEDAPYVVRRIDVDGDDITMTLNDSSREALTPGKGLQIAADNVIYTRVKAGQAGADQDQDHRARLTRAAVQQLEPVLDQADDGFVVRAGATRIPVTAIDQG